MPRRRWRQQRRRGRRDASGSGNANRSAERQRLCRRQHEYRRRFRMGHRQGGGCGRGGTRGAGGMPASRRRRMRRGSCFRECVRRRRGRPGAPGVGAGGDQGGGGARRHRRVQQRNARSELRGRARRTQPPRFGMFRNRRNRRRRFRQIRARGPAAGNPGPHPRFNGVSERYEIHRGSRAAFHGSRRRRPDLGRGVERRKRRDGFRFGSAGNGEFARSRHGDRAGNRD